MKPFSQILTQLIDASEMTQAEVARRADLSIAMVSKMCRGARANPSRDTLFRLSKVFGVSPADFFEE